MSKPEKKRIDQLLVDRGLVESKSKAQALIMAGKVFSDTKRLDKPGHKVSSEIALEIKGQDHPWVSRGGVKLASGLEHFSINPDGCVCVDVGASTGGFTHVLLQNGAKKVYAVDVGHGQLAWKLREDERVVVLEKTNARYLTSDEVPEPIDLVVCDASFIGLQTVLPAVMKLTVPNAHLIALIKPQFEVGKDQVGKGGVVRDPELHQEVCDKIKNWISGLDGWEVLGVSKSPIKGPEGNVEFLMAAIKKY